MPSAAQAPLPAPSAGGGITKFMNGRILKNGKLVNEDLWVNAATGKIVESQEAFYSRHVVPDNIVNLQGRILSPGLIDVQLNGAFGFNFSVLHDDMTQYGKELKRVNKALVRTGVTAYLPTLTSQPSTVYQQTLPFLAPSATHNRFADSGCESLGAHCEGPFLSPTKNGCHTTDVLQTAENGFADFEACYGASNLNGTDDRPPSIKIITAAPEVGNVHAAIPETKKRGIVFSVGHSEATYEQARAATEAGAEMVTHMFNAMRPLHHRNPGIFGLLGQAEGLKRPFFGVISDGIHLHPTSVKIAFNAYPEGFILVTDAMHLTGLADGVYDWSNGDRIVKKGAVLTLEGHADKIAGSAVTLLECVQNFLNWSGAGLPEALAAVTSTPARMLGMEKVKGSLEPGADADLVILDETREGNITKLAVEQTWKFGEKVFDRRA